MYRNVNNSINFLEAYLRIVLLHKRCAFRKVQCSRESYDVMRRRSRAVHWLDRAVNVTSYLILVFFTLPINYEKLRVSVHFAV